MDSLSSTAAPSAAPELGDRDSIPERFKWDLTHIFTDWPEWQRAYDTLETKIAAYAALQGTLAKGADRLLAAMKLSDDIGQLFYKVWFFASLKHDEDQRDNEINARHQQVQILAAKASQASAWFNPELLAIPLPTIQQWMKDSPELAVYRFFLEDLYRQQEHVLDEKGEHLLSLSSRFSSAPTRRLRRAVDRRHQAPDDHALHGRRCHADLRAVPRHPRHQSQPERSREGVHGLP